MTGFHVSSKIPESITFHANNNQYQPRLAKNFIEIS